MEFSLSALTNWLSLAISVGWGLNTNSISFNVTGSDGPSPSVSRSVLPSTLLSDSSDLSEVMILLVLLLAVVWLDGAGDGGPAGLAGGPLDRGLAGGAAVTVVLVVVEVVVMVEGMGEVVCSVVVGGFAGSSLALRDRWGRF